MGEIVVGLMLSAHISLGENFNNLHPSVAYKDNNQRIVGVYKNSYSKPSFYAGYVKNFDGFELHYGAVTGYVLPVVPFVVLKKELEKDVKFVVIPSYNMTHKNPGVIFGIEITK